jgi:hypothetical protein
MVTQYTELRCLGVLSLLEESGTLWESNSDLFAIEIKERRKLFTNKTFFTLATSLFKLLTEPNPMTEAALSVAYSLLLIV